MRNNLLIFSALRGNSNMISIAVLVDERAITIWRIIQEKAMNQYKKICKN